MTPEERQASARHAALARWRKRAGAVTTEVAPRTHEGRWGNDAGHAIELDHPVTLAPPAK